MLWMRAVVSYADDEVMGHLRLLTFVTAEREAEVFCRCHGHGMKAVELPFCERRKWRDYESAGDLMGCTSSMRGGDG